MGSSRGIRTLHFQSGEGASPRSWSCIAVRPEGTWSRGCFPLELPGSSTLVGEHPHQKRALLQGMASPSPQPLGLTRMSSAEGKAFLLEGCSFLLIVLEAGPSISAGGGNLALEVPGGKESITSGGSLRETGPGCVLKF